MLFQQQYNNYSFTVAAKTAQLTILLFIFFLKQLNVNAVLQPASHDSRVPDLIQIPDSQPPRYKCFHAFLLVCLSFYNKI